MAECLFTDCTFPPVPSSPVGACGLHRVALDREMARCFRRDCENDPLPADQRSPRLGGRYCLDCERLTLADADRINAECGGMSA